MENQQETGIIYKLYNQDSIDKDFYIGSTF